MNFFKSKEAKLAASLPPAHSTSGVNDGAHKPVVPTTDSPLSPRHTQSGQGGPAAARVLQHHVSHGDLVSELVRKRGPAALTGSMGSSGAGATAMVSPRGLSSSTPTLPSCPPSPPTPHLPHSPPTSPRSAPTYAPAAASPLATSSPYRPLTPLNKRAPPPPVPSSPRPQAGTRSSPSTSPSSSTYACASPLAATASPSPSSGGARKTPPPLPPLDLTDAGLLPPLPASYPPPPPPPRKALLAMPAMIQLPPPSPGSSEGPSSPSGSVVMGQPVVPKIPLGSSASFPSPVASPAPARQRSNTGDTALARKDAIVRSPVPPSAGSPASSPSSSSSPSCSPTSSTYHAPPLSPRGGYALPSLVERNVEEKAREIQQQLHLHQQHQFELHQQKQAAETTTKKEKSAAKAKDKALKRTVSEKNVPQSMVTTSNPLMSMVSPRTTKKPRAAPALGFAAGSSQERPLRPRKGTDIAGMAIRRNDERKERSNSVESKDGVSSPRRKLTDEGLSDSEADDPLAHMSINRICGTAAASSVAASAGVAPAPLSPREVRQLVVNELIHTEKSYFRDLSLIVEVWMKPLRAQGLFSVEDIGVVFSNVEQLRMLNEELLTSLQGVEEKPADDQDVGRRFARFVDFLKMYFAYCANQTAAIERLQELKKAKPQLQQVLEEIKNRPECNLLDLESYLIKPMQRVTKYPLLLREILKHTDATHSDYAALDNCYTRIAEVVLEINEKKRQSENLVKLIQLQNSFMTIAGEEPVKLISPHRRLVAHGTFKKVFVGTKAPVKVKNGHLFLFNDMLLVASEEGNMFKKASKRKFVIRSGPIAITNVLLWSGNDAEGLVFCVVRMDDSSGQITLQASSPEEKFEWISRINDCIVTLPNGGLRGGGPASREPADVVEKFSRVK